MRLLVIDDDESIRLLLKQMFESIGPEIEVVCAQDLDEAYQILKVEKFQLIFVDLFFPHHSMEDVFEFIEQFRRNGVVILTGNEETGMAYACLRRGALDYVSKSHLRLDHLTRLLGYAEQRQISR